jgi:hypothetical protein
MALDAEHRSMVTRFHFAWIASCLAMLLVAPARAGAQSAAKDEYPKLAEEAVREFNAGNFAEARALFERAHALKPNARTLRGLGLCSFELRHYVQAISELESALHDTRNPLNKSQRREVSDVLGRAQRYVVRVEVELAPAEATLLLDGTPVSGRELVLDLGDYTLIARAPGYQEASMKLQVEGGDARKVRLELLPLNLRVSAPPQAENGNATTAADATGPSPLADRSTERHGSVFGKWWFWTAVGVVVAGGVVGALTLSKPGQRPVERGDVAGVIQTLQRTR